MNSFYIVLPLVTFVLKALWLWLHDVKKHMTDRHKRFNLKISKLKLLWKQRHLQSWMPLR